MAATVVSFGVLTTAAVWALSKPYVTRILVQAAAAGQPRADDEEEDAGKPQQATKKKEEKKAGAMLVIETLDIFARPRQARVPLRNLQPPRPRPLETFYAIGDPNGSGGDEGRGYYVHEDGWLESEDIGIDEDIAPPRHEGEEATLSETLQVARELRRVVDRFQPAPLDL